MTEVIKYKPPTLAELIDDPEKAWEADQFNALLCQQPQSKWVKEHPFIKQEITDEQGNKKRVPYKYLAIDTVEFLLRKIFKEFKIEITGQGTSFNGVWVTVRVNYKNPVTGEWGFHDGIGASQLQTAKGASPAEMQNINNGAISMAFPMAKTLAIKDACDHFGSLFGANLNRRDVIQFEPDKNLDPNTSQVNDIPLELEAIISEADKENLGNIYKSNPEYHSNPRFMELLTKRKEQLNDNPS